MEENKKQKSKEQKQAKHKKESLEELYKKLDILQNEKDELFEKLQRVSADYANFQKRTPKQIADSVGYEKEKIIKTLLPALDNFEHTLQNASSAENTQLFVKGVQIIYDQMLDILKSHQVEQIKSAGEKFDPSLHQAMMQKSEPEKEDGIVLEEFQKGYKLNDRVIRPGKVVVNNLSLQKEKKEPSQTETNDDE